MSRLLVALLVALPLAAFAGHGDAPPLFTQPLSFPSATVTEAQFLSGAAGVPATVGGELRMPITQQRLPVVVLLHGSGGVSPNVRHWSDVLNGLGLGTMIVDSFSGRGIAETSTDQSRLSHHSMLIDAYRALALLGTHPRVDGSRVAVMGFDKGGWAALHAGVRRFQRLYAPKGREFAAQLAFYPPCGARYLEDEQVAPRPIRVFHGTLDDWMPIEPCREYVARVRRAGGDAAMVELTGARHLFELQDLAAQVRLPGVQRIDCLTEERAGGTMVNRATGKPPARDECVKPGATIGFDPRAYEEAMRRVKEALVAALGSG